MHLRINGEFVEGILIPFSTPDKDAYGTYWDRNTDFGLDVFAPHPVLFLHGIGAPTRQGVLTDFQVTDDGLFVRAALNADSPLWELVRMGRAAWSSGAFPTLVDQRSDGYISRWVVVEGSIADVSQVAARDGLTAADYARAGVSLPSQSIPIRSQWLGGKMTGKVKDDSGVWDIGEDVKGAGKDGSNDANKDGGGGFSPADLAGMSPDEISALANRVASGGAPDLAAVSPPVSDNGDSDVGAALRYLADKLSMGLGKGKDDDAPSRSLSPEPVDSPVAAAPTPSIRVSSQYDSIDLLGMLWHHEFNRGIQRFDRSWRYSPSEEYMRALAHKVERQWYQHDADVDDRWLHTAAGSLEVVPMRAISRAAYDAWHARVPYLRADEAMTSTLTSAGDELVPTLLNSALYYWVRLEAKVAPLFDSFIMPSNPYDYPKVTSGPTFYNVGEIEDQSNFTLSSALTTTSQVATGKVTFSASKLSALTLYSKELFEDSGIAVSQMMANVYRDEMAHTLDSVIMNGDTSTRATGNINSDAAAPASGSAYLALNGLLKYPMVTVAANSVDMGNLNPTSAKMQQALQTMGIMGRDLPNLVMITDPTTAYAIDTLDEFMKLNEVGDLATLIKGQLGFWRGIPVVVSEDLPRGQADGKVGAGANDRGRILFAHRKVFKLGMRREFSLEQMAVPGIDGYYVAGSMRLDFKYLEGDGSAALYNVKA